MRNCIRAVLAAFFTGLTLAGPPLEGARAFPIKRGNVVFFHPDGTGLSHWHALRLLKAGPDGMLNWDRLPATALYSGHMKDALTSTSHGGATVHAYGVKVAADSFGLDGTAPITAASGAIMSIMQEARQAGMATGLVQTGHIAEPGTAAFVASAPDRGMRAEIARQVILDSGADVIMAGGERYLLPEGVLGHHGPGERTDGLNLIERARKNGYTVVYTARQLATLDLSEVDRLLGVFAHDATFNAAPEEDNAANLRPHYEPAAPSIADMTGAALSILSRADAGFFLVAEEEGTDNMANRNNAAGQLEALARADAAIRVIRSHIEEHDDTLMLMTADSEAGGLSVLGPRPEWMAADEPLPATDRNGAPMDGAEGTGSLPFIAAPDRFGNRWPFAITWATRHDTSGEVLVRAAGRNHQLVRGRLDNTDIYRLMYLTLFGRLPE